MRHHIIETLQGFYNPHYHGYVDARIVIVVIQRKYGVKYNRFVVWCVLMALALTGKLRKRNARFYVEKYLG